MSCREDKPYEDSEKLSLCNFGGFGVRPTEVLDPWFERPSFMSKPSAKLLIQPYSSGIVFWPGENCTGDFKKGQ